MWSDMVVRKSVELTHLLFRTVCLLIGYQALKQEARGDSLKMY